MLVAGDLGPHGAGHGDHDADVEGLELQAEHARVAVDGSLGGGVDGAEDVRADGADGGDVDDEASRGDEELGEFLGREHGAKDVGLICLPDIVYLNVQSRDGVSSAAARFIVSECELTKRDGV